MPNVNVIAPPEAKYPATEKPQYRLLSSHFIEPHFLKEGQVISYDGEPTPEMEPMNAAAEARLAAYFKKFPKATIAPVENLSLTVMQPELPGLNKPMEV